MQGAYMAEDSRHTTMQRITCVSATLNFAGLVQYATICLKMSPKKLLCAFVLSRLDYCNSLLAGCPKYLLSKLPKVQNNAARLIFRTTRYAHVTPILHSLHWLPIEQRIEYKLSLLCFKIISHQAPIYLSELLHLYTPSRLLRSSTDTRMFRIPSFRTKSCGQRSFSYQAAGSSYLKATPCFCPPFYLCQIF